MALTDFLAQPNRSSDVTKDIIIYANGADFEYGELAINTSEAGKNANFTIKVYDAKNLRVWGNTPNAGVTQNIILETAPMRVQALVLTQLVASSLLMAKPVRSI